jgi:hypothetical protein
MTPTVSATATPPLLNDYIKSKGVVAFPNPAKHSVTFAWKHEGVEKAKIVVYSLSGEKIAVIEADQPIQQRLTWQVHDIAPGIYLYRTSLTIDGKEEVMKIKKLAIIK